MSENSSIFSKRMWDLSIAMFVLLPLGMAIAHRSSILFLVLSAVFALIACCSEGTFHRLTNDFLGDLTGWLGRSLVAFLVWVLASFLWTYSIKVAFFSLGEFLLAFVSGYVLVRLLPAKITKFVILSAAVVVIIASCLIFIDLKSGMYFREMAGARAGAFVYNRSVITLFLVMFPLAFLLFKGEDRGNRVIALMGILVATGVIFYSDSGAAKMAVLVAIPVYMIAAIWPKFSAYIAGFCFLAIFLLAPVYGTLFYKILPHDIIEMFRSNHSIERVNLWLAFEYAIWQQPFLGGGFCVSPVIVNTPIIAFVPADLYHDINMGHPHNAAMQIWVELGAVGVALAMTILLFLLKAIQNLPKFLFPQVLAWIAGITLIAIVGHGAWQGWWVASISAGAVWLRVQRLKTNDF